jgi:hypothetical protein
MRLNSFKQQFQSCPFQFMGRHVGPIADQPALLKSFSSDAQTGPVKVQDFDLIGAAVSEGERTSRQGINSHAVFDQGIRVIKGQSHARGLNVQKHADLPFGKEH